MFAASSLTGCVDEWKDVCASDTVLNWIARGVSIHGIEDIQSFELDNHKLDVKKLAFLRKEVRDLEKSGAVRRAGCKPFCVSPIGVVPKKNGKFRIITDLRKLNGYSQAPHFVNESI